MNCTRMWSGVVSGAECPDCGHAMDVHQSEKSSKEVPAGIRLPATSCLPCAMEELVAKARWIVSDEQVVLPMVRELCRLSEGGRNALVLGSEDPSTRIAGELIDIVMEELGDQLECQRRHCDCDVEHLWPCELA